jgi:hypothetical protein
VFFNSCDRGYSVRSGADDVAVRPQHIRANRKNFRHVIDQQDARQFQVMLLKIVAKVSAARK